MELAYLPTDGSADPEPAAEIGGSLDFNGNGIAGCVSCGWRGVPNIVGSEIHGPLREQFRGDGGTMAYSKGGHKSTFCPACETDAHAAFDMELRRRRVLAGLPVAPLPHAAKLPGRNQPCICGSGKKFKRCCG